MRRFEEWTGWSRRGGRPRPAAPRWRLAASVAMLLAVALGAGLVTAGFTLPPPQPPQPPAAPAGDLGNIPGFAPATTGPPAVSQDAERSGSPLSPGTDPGGTSGDPDQGRDRPPDAPAAPDTTALPDSRDPDTGSERDPDTVRTRSLTATRAPAAPPPIPSAVPTQPAGDDAAAAGDDAAAAGDDTAANAVPRPGGPPMPPAGDPAAPAPPAAGGAPSAGTGTTTGPPALARSAPRRIQIPSIGVNAEVIEVGVDRTGGLEVPPFEQPAQAGWYRLGPSPGEAGNAVIVGHVDTRKYGPAVFFNLGRLRPGELITVTRADGSTVRFAVDAVRLFPKAEFPSHAVYGSGGESRLRIVTCGGRFDREIRDYLDNVVAFASRVP